MDQRSRFDANCSMLFTEVPLLERPAAAKAAGFDAVEFWWPFSTAYPSDVEVDRFVAAVADAGVRLVGLNFAAGDMPAGERGLVSVPGRGDEFRNSVEVAVAIGERLGIEAFNALYGLRVDGIAPEAQDELAVENLLFAARAAQAHGAVVLIEPVSGVPAYPVRRFADALAVVERVRTAGSEAARVLLDLYHLAVNGDPFGPQQLAELAHIGHVQIADAPGRHEPGTGELDLLGALAGLGDAGYNGWVGLEYSPSTSTAASLGWLPVDRRGVVAANRATDSRES